MKIVFFGFSLVKMSIFDLDDFPMFFYDSLISFPASFTLSYM